MGTQILVNEKGVQRRGIEAGEEHVHHNDQVDLTVLQPQRQVFVVVLEPGRRGVERRAVHGVVVLDRTVQERPGVPAQPTGIKTLLIKDAVLDRIVGTVGEDQADLQTLIRRQTFLLFRELVVVGPRRRNRRGREQGVEATYSPLA